MAKSLRCYALYHGDDFVDVGTISEIASRMGIKEDTIRFYGYPSYKKRIEGSKDSYELIRLEENE